MHIPAEITIDTRKLAYAALLGYATGLLIANLSEHGRLIRNHARRLNLIERTINA